MSDSVSNNNNQKKCGMKTDCVLHVCESITFIVVKTQHIDAIFDMEYMQKYSSRCHEEGVVF